MALKVSFKGIDKVQKDFQKFLDQTKKNPIILREVGDTAVKYIRGSVRAGRDVYKMSGLSDSTIESREDLARDNPTDSTYKSNRSNLTLTGEFLNSMGHRVNVSIGQVTIFFEGIHSQYLDSKGNRIGERKTNAEIASELNSNPKFKFLFISDKLKLLLKAKIKAGMRRQLSNYRKARKILGG